jgi:hypothetical protein
MKNIYFLINFLIRTISQSSICEKVDNSSVIKKSAKRFLLPLIFLFVAFATEQSNAQVNFTANVSWPCWAGENWFRIRTGTNSFSAPAIDFCAPGNCYNGANVNYTATGVNLGSLPMSCTGYFIEMFDSYGDGWNCTGTLTLFANGVNVGTYALAAGGYGTAALNLPAAVLLGCSKAAEAAAVGSGAVACNNATLNLGSGAFRDLQLAANTWYNFSWANNGGGTTNGFCANIIAGGAGATSSSFTANQTCWFSGTTAPTVRISANRSVCTWSATSAVMTYRHTQPTVGAPSTTQVNFCDAGGNFGTAVTSSSTLCGNVVWDWGSNNGVWNNNWIAGTSSGVCCFPKKTSNSDGNADRIRYRVVNNGCEVTSGTILITNRWNEAPSTLTLPTSTYCSNSAPANITLNANFPNAVNMNGTVNFYSGSCGGTLVGSVVASANSSTVSLVIAAPATTTNYFVRYEPGAGTGCGNTVCVSATVTVNSPSTAPTSINATTNPTCGGSTTLSVVGGSLGTGATWQWYSASCGGASVGSGASIAVSPGSTTTYFVRAEGTCNTTACASLAVTVNTLSSAPTSINATTNPTCGGSTTLSVVGGSLGTGATWQWYSASCGGTSVGSGASIAVSPATNTAYFVRAEGTCNTTTCASLAVTVNSPSTAPTSINATTNPTCGGSTTLSVVGGSLGTGATWQWYSGSCGGTFVGTGTSVAVSPGSTTTYFVRAEGTCNTTACASLAVTVNTASTAAAGITVSTNPVCVGSSTTLEVSGGSLGSGATWQWYSTSCGGTSVGSGASIAVSPTSNTTYYVRAEGTCNTTSCVSTVVNVNTLSTAPTSISATVNPICSGNSTTLSVIGGSLGTGATWQWYSSSCGGVSVGSGASIAVSPTSNTTYFVRAEGTCNTTTCASLAITVHANSVAPTAITGVTNICNGGSTTLTVSGGSLGAGASWQWYSASCGGSSVGSGPSVLVSPTSNTTYFVRAEGTCNNTTCASVSISVQPQPTAPTTAPKDPNVVAVCTGTSVGLSGAASGGTDAGCTIEYRFSTDEGATWSAPSTTIPTGMSSAVAGTDRIQVEARRVSCLTGCSNTGWGQVATWSVLTQPTSPTTAPKSPNVTNVCTNTNVGISGPATGGTNRACVINYRYSTDGGVTWSGESTTLPTGLSSSIAGANRIQIQARRVDCTTSGCDDTSWNTVAIWNVDPQPTAPTTATKNPDQPSICVSGTAGLSGPASGGSDAGCDIEYRYSLDGGVVWSASSTTVPTGLSTTLLGTNIIRIDARRVNCLNPGCNDTGWNTIAAWSIVGEPTVASAGSNHGPICQNSSVTLAANNPSVGSGSWSVVSGPSTSPAQFSNVLSTSSSFTPAGGGGTYVLRWTISNNPCTPSTSDVSVFVDGLPTASAGGLATICQNGAATVIGASATNGTIQWTHNGAGSLTNATTLTPTYNAAAGDAGNTVTLTMTVTSNNTCGAATATAFYSINVESLPSASAGGSTTICPGDPATVTGASAANGNILWSHDGAGSIANATTLTPTYTSVLADEGNIVTLTMTVTSNNSCNPIDSTATYTVLVSGNSIAATGIDASSTTVCEGSQVVLTVDGGNLALGADWEWYDDAALTNNVGSGSPISFYPTATTTYYVRAEGVCNTTAATDITITVQTGAGNAFLVTGNRPGAEEECLDGAWTYYSTSTNPDQYIFAIRKNGNNFTARVDIYDIPGTTTYSSVGGVGPARGTFLIGRHWDVTVLSGSVTNPVDVRFFVDPAEVLQAETEALALLGSTALPGSTITPLTFFKTPDGVSFNPSTMMVNGNFTFTPANTWITPASGTLNGYTYYQLDGITNFSGGTGGFSINDGGAPLPVELLSFTATAINNEYVQLDWSTATEVDNDGFFVERSTDGSNFTQIAWVDGNGSTTQTQYYTYDDREAVAGVNYYRLKQVDFNGDYEYTYIVSAVLRKDVTLLDVLGLRPNPTVNELFVEILAHTETKANFTTFNHMGQKVQTFGKVLEEGQNTVSVNTTDLPAGTYFITIENSQTKITKKFVVIK